MKIWLLNHTSVQCGIYQYGVRMYDILKKSTINEYCYKELSSFEEYRDWIETQPVMEDKTAIMYNYHPIVMPWLNGNIIHKDHIYNICIPHECWINGFDAYFAIDPNEPDPKYALKMLRPIFEDFLYKESCAISEIPKFGSFGFGSPHKGFDKVIKIVSENYENAIIHLLITVPHFGGNSNDIENLKRELLEIPRKPGIILNIRTDFISNDEEVLQFLDANDVNIFMYDKMEGRGISSAIDYALSVQKPIIISDSAMFRNVYDDRICVYKTPIRECIENSSQILNKIRLEYSHSKLINQFDTFFAKTFPKYLCINTSVGELVDKYSILELKQKYIKSSEKRENIDYEHSILHKYVKDYIGKYPEFYKQLVHINDLIWKDTDSIKQLDYFENSSDFAEIADSIFENNQCRFRIKSWFNTLFLSQIVEQKGYEGTGIVLKIKNSEDLYKHVGKINWYCVHYDNVYLVLHKRVRIIEEFKQPNLHICDAVSTDISSRFWEEWLDYSKDLEEGSLFEPTPIRYFASGRLGDFINQLSVVCENYWNTGRRGIIYVSNVDPCMNANFEDIYKTYEDIGRFIKSQPYVEDFRLKFDCEETDINLTLWRQSVYMPYETYHELYKRVYNIDWAKHPWFTMNYDFPYSEKSWSNKTIFNITKLRFPNESQLERIKKVISEESDCVFVAHNIEDYEYFIEKTGLNIPLYNPQNFDEFVFIVYSCKCAYLGLSAPATFANAFHKKHILIGSDKYAENFLADTRKTCPHILDFL